MKREDEFLTCVLKIFTFKILDKHKKNLVTSPHINHIIHLKMFMLHFFTKNRVMSDPCFDARDCLLTWLLSLA